MHTHTHTCTHTQNQKGRSIRQVRKKKGSYQCHLSQGVAPQCSKCQVDQSLQTSLLISEISIFYCCNSGLGCRTIHQSQTQQKDDACLHSDEFHQHSFSGSLGCLADFLKKFIAYMTLSTCVTWQHTAVSVKYYSPGFYIICKFLDEPELIFSCICFKIWLKSWSLLLTLHSPVMLA